MLELLECGLCFLAGGVIIGVWVDLWHSKRYKDLEKECPKEFEVLVERYITGSN